MSLTSFVSISAKIDWNSDGDFGDSGEDVSADVQYPVTTKRGRQEVVDVFQAGTAAFSLRNGDGTYTPLYASSPLYPNVLPGRVCQLQVTYNAVTYDLFKGRCSPSSGRFAPDGQMNFEAIDAFEQLRLGLTNTALQQSKRVDQLITAILDDISWPAGDRDLGTGLETLTVFTNHNRLPLNALQLAATQDPGAALFMSRAGKVVYQNRQYRSLRPVYATLAGTFDDIDQRIRLEDMADYVRATYPRYSTDAAVSAVFTLNTPRWLQPGTGSFDFDINASGVAAASAYVTPLVAVTDFAANSALDGGGTSKTAQVSLSVSASSSGGGTISYTNLDSSQVALTFLQVRALATKAGAETNAVRVAVAAPVVTGQQLNQDFEFQDNVDPVRGWVNWQANVRGAVRVRPVVTITPDTDALMAIVLGAEIGNRITLTDTGAPWLTQVSGDHFIEAIDLAFEGPGLVRARWTLFPADLAGGSFFRISGALGGGADYSQIVAAAATTGDRLAY